MRKTTTLLALALAFAVLLVGCGKNSPEEKLKQSLTKRASKFVAEKALDVVDGLSEAVEERGQETSEKLTKAAGNVAAGTAEGMAETMDKHGNEIGKNITSATADVLGGALEEAEKRVDEAEEKANQEKKLPLAPPPPEPIDQKQEIWAAVFVAAS